MITPQGIRDIVAKHSKNILDKQILPHDLRRTYAQLSYKAGAPLRQVQLSLGHSSIRTTEIYLGLDQDLTNAPGDYLDIIIQDYSDEIMEEEENQTLFDPQSTCI